MALSLNRVILMGFIGAEPEEHNANGHTVCTLNMGVTERFKNHNGEVNETTDWIEVACFGQGAKYALNYLHKGDLIAVEGKIKTSKYADKRTGEIRKSMQVHCTSNSLTLIRRTLKEDTQNYQQDNSQQQLYEQNQQNSNYNSNYQNQRQNFISNSANFRTNQNSSNNYRNFVNRPAR